VGIIYGANSQRIQKNICLKTETENSVLNHHMKFFLFTLGFSSGGLIGNTTDVHFLGRQR
jgi:hypothetical protein